jgi:hypothetical protein
LFGVYFHQYGTVAIAIHAASGTLYVSAADNGRVGEFIVNDRADDVVVAPAEGRTLAKDGVTGKSSTRCVSCIGGEGEDVVMFVQAGSNAVRHLVSGAPLVHGMRLIADLYEVTGELSAESSASNRYVSELFQF